MYMDVFLTYYRGTDGAQLFNVRTHACTLLLYCPPPLSHHCPAALDIQMLTQFSQGSGASYGFAASNASSFWSNFTDAQVYLATLAMKPLPDVFVWSISGGLEDAAGEATLAKMAAMGVTLIVASGDHGAFSCNGASSYDEPLLPSYPSASPWVRAVYACVCVCVCVCCPCFFCLCVVVYVMGMFVLTFFDLSAHCWSRAQ